MCLSPARGRGLISTEPGGEERRPEPGGMADSLTRELARGRERAYLSGLPPEAIPSVHSRAPRSPSLAGGGGGGIS